MAAKARILVVDDQESILTLLKTILNSEGYEVITAHGGDIALELLQAESFDLMITDIEMEPVSGMDLLKECAKKYSHMGVILMTGYGSVNTAINGLKLGAFDYVHKPFKVEDLMLTVQRSLGHISAQATAEETPQPEIKQYRFPDVVEESSAMHTVCDVIQRVAPTDTAVLIVGESGTPRETIARTIHAQSQRKKKNFAAVNCAEYSEALLEAALFGHTKDALPGVTSDKQGLLEQTPGGTVFLDEVNAMPLNIQEKVLQVFQTRAVRPMGGGKSVPVDVRILAASSSNLRELTEQGQFRMDLYRRLSIIPVVIKPLRERKEDIMQTVFRALRAVQEKDKPLPAIEPEALKVLKNYTWPGNEAELHNTLKHALSFVTDNRLSSDMLPLKMVTAVKTHTAVGTSPEEFRGQQLRIYLKEQEAKKAEEMKKRAARVLQEGLGSLPKPPNPE